MGELPLLEFQEGGSYLFVEQAHVDVVFGQRKFKIAHNKVNSITLSLHITFACVGKLYKKIIPVIFSFDRWLVYYQCLKFLTL